MFETLLVDGGVAGQPGRAPRPAGPQRRELYGESLPAIDVPRSDGAVRITYVPGRPVSVQWRALTPRPVPVVLTPHVLPGGLGAHKWVDRRLLEELSKDGTTPLLLDADGTVLEAAWAAVLIRRDGRLYTPREDGRILPSTSRPDAIQADLRLEPGDELLLSSSLAGVVPAVVADASPGPRAGTPRTPSRTGALSVGSS